MMFDELRGFYHTLFLLKPTKDWLYIFVSILAVAITGKLSYSITKLVVEAQTPKITIYAPSRNTQTSEWRSNIVGKVTPSDSKIKINGQSVTVNDQGTFSYQMTLESGENKFTIVAKNLWKESQYSDQIAQIDSPKTDSIALQSNIEQLPPQSATVLGKQKRTEKEELELKKSMIIDMEEVKRGDNTILRGRMKNKTGETIGWIKITANFKDESGKLLDSQIVYVTSADQYLAPEALMSFVLPITTVNYSYYELDMEYESMG